MQCRPVEDGKPHETRQRRCDDRAQNELAHRAATRYACDMALQASELNQHAWNQIEQGMRKYAARATCLSSLGGVHSAGLDHRRG